jgi:uncharacterized protein with ParB-like and HNH nuclease domain
MSDIIKNYIDGKVLSEDEAKSLKNSYRSDINAWSVSDFLSSGTNIKKKIPEYQRPYSWENKHINEFLEDTLRVSKEDNKGWFLGTIFIVKDGIDTVNLLDGQQRITSIHLILREVLAFEFHDDYGQVEEDVKAEFDLVKHDISKALYNNRKGRFIPESNSKDFLKKYLENPISFHNKNTFTQWRSDLDTYLSAPANTESESQTHSVLRLNIDLIRDFLTNKVVESANINEGIKSLNSFTNTLLNKLFFIVVPLRNDRHSIEFFEGLNNRGKSLSLVDRLRFKSLTWASKLTIDEDAKESLINDIRKKWKDLYVEISKGVSDNKCYLKSHEEFYSDYFTANEFTEINNDKATGKTDIDQYIEVFTEKHLANQDSLNDFFNQCNWLIDLLNNLARPTTTKNSLTSQESLQANELLPNKKKRIQALFTITNKLIQASKASRYLLICLCSNFNPNLQLSSVLSGIWNANKLIFWIDFVRGYEANRVRTTCHRVNRLISIGNYKGQTINYTNYFKVLVDKEKTEADNNDDTSIIEGVQVVDDNAVLNNDSISKELGENDKVEYLATKNNSVSGYILYLYCYLIDYEGLVNNHPDDYIESSLEHIFPSAFKANWSEESNYKKDEVVNYYNSIKESYDFKLKENTIEDSDEFELKNYTSQPFSQQNALNQWIGNKLYILASENTKLSNKGFDRKKVILNEGNFLVIPPWSGFPVSSGHTDISQCDSWGSSQIVKRSIEICDLIFKNVYFMPNSWDSF